ncbi:MAG: J domain-containing protein [Oscillospiraceae bacterium]|nr:J domain-containing protein [Oscillospiraceae bacterium]
MSDPYQILGISPDASDEQVKAAYRELARKYHPDNHTDNPLSDLAQQKMQEINEAYDAIIRQRRSGGARGGSRFSDIRRMISAGRIFDAEVLLDGMAASDRDAEWHFLKGSVLYRKGWLDDAHNEFSAACSMDPANAEYRAAFNRMNTARQNGSYYRGGGNQMGCSVCDICTGLLCCECLTRGCCRC